MFFLSYTWTSSSPSYSCITANRKSPALGTFGHFNRDYSISTLHDKLTYQHINHSVLWNYQGEEEAKPAVSPPWFPLARIRRVIRILSLLMDKLKTIGAQFSRNFTKIKSHCSHLRPRLQVTRENHTNPAEVTFDIKVSDDSMHGRDELSLVHQSHFLFKRWRGVNDVK